MRPDASGRNEQRDPVVATTVVVQRAQKHAWRGERRKNIRLAAAARTAQSQKRIHAHGVAVLERCQSESLPNHTAKLVHNVDRLLADLERVHECQFLLLLETRVKAIPFTTTHTHYS